METQADYQRIKDNLSCQKWRLNNLYYIKTKKGKKVKFKLNLAQQYLFNNRWYFNIILKARQLGFTTFIMIYFLDSCLFNSNHSAGVIAHTQHDANDLFEDKIKFAYDNLPAAIKAIRPCTSDSARKLAFSNGSLIYTGVSLRGGTLQKLLISEYGKISAKAPEKAKEIRTGALNTIESGQQIFIESTAEGKVGEFYKLVEKARKLADTNKKLAKLEPKFFFFAWWQNPEYASSEFETRHTVITEEDRKYFESLEEHGIKLSREQQSWYVIKKTTQEEDMTQEFPSIPDEAFQGSLQGAYYSKAMKHVRKNGQITNIPYDSRYPVITWWDLGLNDMMTVWFYQFIKNQHRFIDYHESSEEGWQYYARLLTDKDYNYLFHGFPHDGNKRVRTKEVVTDKQLAQDCGIRPIKITKRTSNKHQEVVNVCAPVLKNCWFDESKCAKGIVHLDNYRKRWSKADVMFLKEPEHDEASHGADGFRTFAANEHKIVEWTTLETQKPVDHRNTAHASWMQ